MTQSGYYSMQCTCGFWSSAHLKPQNRWTAEEIKREADHQIFHLTQQAMKPDNIVGNSLWLAERPAKDLKDR